MRKADTLLIGYYVEHFKTYTQKKEKRLKRKRRENKTKKEKKRRKVTTILDKTCLLDA